MVVDDDDGDDSADQFNHVTTSSFSPENEERQLNSSIQGDSVASPSGKRCRSPSGSDRTDSRGIKRVRSPSHPSEAAENG